jgi:hypothetical protein
LFIFDTDVKVTFSRSLVRLQSHEEDMATPPIFMCPPEIMCLFASFLPPSNVVYFAQTCKEIVTSLKPLFAELNKKLYEPWVLKRLCSWKVWKDAKFLSTKELGRLYQEVYSTSFLDTGFDLETLLFKYPDLFKQDTQTYFNLKKFCNISFYFAESKKAEEEKRRQELEQDKYLYYLLGLDGSNSTNFPMETTTLGKSSCGCLQLQ